MVSNYVNQEMVESMMLLCCDVLPYYITARLCQMPLVGEELQVEGVSPSLKIQTIIAKNTSPPKTDFSQMCVGGFGGSENRTKNQVKIF